MSDWFEAEQHVERAHELYEAGRWEEAESELRAALSLNPYQAEWHYNLGLTLDAAGRFDDAGRSFEEAHRLSPDHAPAAMMVGVALLRAEKPREAMGWLEEASRLDPDDPAPLVHRIRAHAMLGEHDQAEVLFYMVQQVEEPPPDAFLAMADSLLDRGQHDKAVWCLREASRLDPRMPGVQSRLAEVYARTGRPERARQLYLRELRLSPGDVDVILDLGSVLVEMNRLAEAGEKFRLALELEPENPDVHFEIADLAERTGDLDGAIKHFHVALRLDEHFAEARRRLAGALLDRGREADRHRARELLLKELARLRAAEPAAEAGLCRGLARLLMDAAMSAEAVRLLRPVVEADPSDGEARHLLSTAYFEVGNLRAGEEQAREALRADPRNIAPMYNLALACIRSGRWGRARCWIRQARAIDPDDASLRRLLLVLQLHSFVEAGAWLLGHLLRRRRAA